MNIWVRTQDKQILKQVSTFKIVEDEDVCVYLIQDQDNEILGVYETQKRCEEILNDIENYLLIEEKFIYEMPKE